MSRSILTAVTLAAALGFAGFALAEGMAGMNMAPATAPASQPASQPTTTAGAVDLGNTVCPVSGDNVGGSKLFAVYEGKIYHFCCRDCPKDFGENPAKYAKLVAEDPAKYGVKK